MKFRLVTIGIATVMALVGCQGNMNEEGVDDSNIEPTRYNDQQQNRDPNMNRVRDDDDGVRDGKRGQDRRDDRNNMNDDKEDNDNKYEVADEASDRITSEIKEVDNASVLTTNNNAYVAVMVDQDDDTDKEDKGKPDNEVHDRNITNSKKDGGADEVTDDVKQQISEVVQDVDNNIDNVYVSSNPDFIDLMDNYVNDVNAGKPIRGLFDQMGNMIERVFPQDRR